MGTMMGKNIGNIKESSVSLQFRMLKKYKNEGFQQSGRDLPSLVYKLKQTVGGNHSNLNNETD